MIFCFHQKFQIWSACGWVLPLFISSIMPQLLANSYSFAHIYMDTICIESVALTSLCGRKPMYIAS